MLDDIEISKLQYIQNVTACLAFYWNKHDHSTLVVVMAVLLLSLLAVVVQMLQMLLLLLVM